MKKVAVVLLLALLLQTTPVVAADFKGGRDVAMVGMATISISLLALMIYQAVSSKPKEKPTIKEVKQPKPLLPQPLLAVHYQWPEDEY